MKIIVTLDVSEDSIHLDQINDEDNLAELGRDDEPFESKLEYLEFVAEQLSDDEIELNDVVDQFNAVVEVEAKE